MKRSIFLGLAGAIFLAAGCVKLPERITIGGPLVDVRVGGYRVGSHEEREASMAMYQFLDAWRTGDVRRAEGLVTGRELDRKRVAEIVGEDRGLRPEAAFIGEMRSKGPGDYYFLVRLIEDSRRERETYAVAAEARVERLRDGWYVTQFRPERRHRVSPEERRRLTNEAARDRDTRREVEARLERDRRKAAEKEREREEDRRKKEEERLDKERKDREKAEREARKREEERLDKERKNREKAEKKAREEERKREEERRKRRDRDDDND